MTTTFNTAAYQVGIKAERQVIAQLQATPSTKKQNIEQDIDYIYKGIAISLKTQHIALRTNNLAFELEVEFANGVTQKSWYYNGTAEYYHFLIGCELYAVKCSDIKDYVFMYGFDSKKPLNNKSRQSQANIGHSHVNSLCGLINVNKLLKAEVLVKIANIH